MRAQRRGPGLRVRPQQTESHPRGRRWNRRGQSWTGSGPGGHPVGRAQQGSLCQEGETAVVQERPSSSLGAWESCDRGPGPGGLLRDSTGLLFDWEYESWPLTPTLCVGQGGQARPCDSTRWACPEEPQPICLPSARWVLAGFQGSGSLEERPVQSPVPKLLS